MFAGQLGQVVEELGITVLSCRNVGVQMVNVSSSMAFHIVPEAFISWICLSAEQRSKSALGTLIFEQEIILIFLKLTCHIKAV